VRGIDGTSRNTCRPAGVAETFQVRKHSVEAHRLPNKPRNILAKHPSRPHALNDPSHFRPEITVIFCASALPGVAPRLAGEPACENRSVVGPSGEPQSKWEPPDPGEEVDLSVGFEVIGFHLSDIALVHVA
tara:strand:- start:223 stop:615 length:393 start_codon:yes stop_codon:yes gene_type:complete